MRNTPEKRVRLKTEFWSSIFGNGPNTVSESTVPNTELSEFFRPCRGPGGELSEFLSAYYCVQTRTHRLFSQNSQSLPKNSVTSLFPSGPLDRWSAILSLLHPLDRYRTPLCDWECDWEGPIPLYLASTHTGRSSQPTRSNPLAGLNRAKVVL